MGLDEALEEGPSPLAQTPGLAEALLAAAVLGTPFCETSAPARPAPPSPERADSRRGVAVSTALGPGQLELREAPDKYEVRGPDIDCASRLHLCQARCCTLTFALTQQDVDEGVVRWDPERPYRIARREDRTCVHLTCKACSIYAHRPGVCRAYDCRQDARIWRDFDQRIPAPPNPGDTRGG